MSLKACFTEFTVLTWEKRSFFLLVVIIIIMILADDGKAGNAQNEMVMERYEPQQAYERVMEAFYGTSAVNRKQKQISYINKQSNNFSKCMWSVLFSKNSLVNVHREKLADEYLFYVLFF